MRLTGSVKAAENYVFKSFWREMEIKMHCFKRRRQVSSPRIPLECTMNLSSNDLVLLIVGVNSLFTEPMSHP